MERDEADARAPREISLESAMEREQPDDEEAARRDADAMVGDEEPGGTVAVPDHDSVDEWARALGVERSPESPLRASSEVLGDRDARRPGHPPPPKI